MQMCQVTRLSPSVDCSFVSEGRKCTYVAKIHSNGAGQNYLCPSKHKKSLVNKDYHLQT